MSTQAVPQSYFTTTGEVKLSKNGSGNSTPFFSLYCRITPASAAIKHAFPVDLPANAVVDAVHLRAAADATQVTGTSIGIGGTGDPDEFVEFASSLADEADEKTTQMALRVNPSASSKTLYLHSTNGSGAGAGTIIGDWYVRVTGYIVNPIATS